MDAVEVRQALLKSAWFKQTDKTFSIFVGRERKKCHIMIVDYKSEQMMVRDWQRWEATINDPYYIQFSDIGHIEPQ